MARLFGLGSGFTSAHFQISGCYPQSSIVLIICCTGIPMSSHPSIDTQDGKSRVLHALVRSILLSSIFISPRLMCCRGVYDEGVSGGDSFLASPPTLLKYELRFLATSQSDRHLSSITVVVLVVWLLSLLVVSFLQLPTTF